MDNIRKFNCWLQDSTSSKPCLLRGQQLDYLLYSFKFNRVCWSVSCRWNLQQSPDCWFMLTSSILGFLVSVYRSCVSPRMAQLLNSETALLCFTVLNSLRASPVAYMEMNWWVGCFLHIQEQTWHPCLRPHCFLDSAHIQILLCLQVLKNIWSFGLVFLFFNIFVVGGYFFIFLVAGVTFRLLVDVVHTCAQICHLMHVLVRRQPGRISSLALASDSLDPYTGSMSWWHVSLPTKPDHWALVWCFKLFWKVVLSCSVRHSSKCISNAIILWNFY